MFRNRQRRDPSTRRRIRSDSLRMTEVCIFADHQITRDYAITRSISVSPCLRGRFLVFSAPPRLRGEYALQITRSLHSASSAYAVGTNGDSWVATWRRPEITLIHCSADSITITLTNRTKSPQTAASSWSLKILRCRPAMAGPEANCRACASNPIRGLGSKTLCHDAANVTDTSHASGPSVTHM